ncbi:MAG: FAD:protein FMN transferase [Anaerolineae bacterium]|nr:FAD:protein FMN transferase [Anaerolineae bacterium]
MGCEIEAFLDLDDAAADQVLDQVPGWFYRWEKIFSRFLPDSELSRVNRNAGSRTEVSMIFEEVLRQAVKAYQTSGGLVSPAMLPALMAAGYTESFDLLDGDQSSPSVDETAVFDPGDIEFDPADGKIFIPKGMQLDFGGIAKGWAAHQAMRQLSEYGPALVNAGGDIAVGSPLNDGSPWDIHIADPYNEGTDLETFGIAALGVATSGANRRRWQQNGKWRHHIIDPRTNLPAESDIVTATVLGPTVVDAEMAAKTVLILGSQTGFVWLEDHEEFCGMAVLNNRQVLFDPTLEQIRKSYVS